MSARFSEEGDDCRLSRHTPSPTHGGPSPPPPLPLPLPLPLVLMDLATLVEKANAIEDETEIVRAIVKCSITNIKEFNFRERTTFELIVNVVDGTLDSEILIHHNVVQEKIGFSLQEVTSSLISSGSQRVMIKSKLKTFQLFLINFEGTMIVEMSKAFPIPIAVEMNHCVPATDISGLGEGVVGLDEVPEEPQSLLFNLCSHNITSVILSIIGAICTGLFPFQLLEGISARLLAFVMICGFSALAHVGFKKRNSTMLWVPPSQFWRKFGMMLITSAITVAVSLTYKISELSIIGFTFLAIAMFCLTMIAYEVNRDARQEVQQGNQQGMLSRVRKNRSV